MTYYNDREAPQESITTEGGSSAASDGWRCRQSATLLGAKAPLLVVLASGLVGLGAGLAPLRAALRRRPPPKWAPGIEGRAKKKKPQTHVHLPDRASKKYLPTFFSFFFFFKKVFIAFLRVSRHGEPRNSEKPFLEIFWS